MLKIMGSILVFAAAAGMAGTYKRELADHLALLYALRKLLVDLSCYGNGTRQPVEVLLGCFVRTPDEQLNEICRKIADCLIEKNEKNGEQVWKRVFEEYRKKLCLTGEESALIGEAGGALFGRSEEENHRRLTLILEQLDDRIKTVRGELGEKQKIYATVSMVMGGMLVILLIKIAAVGILVTVIGQVLKHSGREEHAFLTSLAGLIIVLFWIVPYIYELFETMQSLFAL